MIERERDNTRAPAVSWWALTAVLAIAGSASAEPVRFDNPDAGEPNHFDWTRGDGFTATTWLDITKPATDQGGLSGTSSVAQLEIDGEFFDASITPFGAAVAQFFLLTVSVGLGDEISDSTLDFSPFAIHAIFDAQAVFSLIPEGVERYLGVSFHDQDDVVHYGWIGVNREGADLHTFAWGYETEALTAINAGIPTPGSLALLAIAGALSGPRRRRSVRIFLRRQP
jgi:hypothetical protein